MGYEVRSAGSRLEIKRENWGEALKALKALMRREDLMQCTYFNARQRACPRFKWVNHEAVNKARTLPEALKAWRWEALASPLENLGSILQLEFTGEFLGDEDVLFEALAPYAEAGGWVRLEGEDGAVIVWNFTGRTVIRTVKDGDWCPYTQE